MSSKVFYYRRCNYSNHLAMDWAGDAGIRRRVANKCRHPSVSTAHHQLVTSYVP
jgi:hypothetical protein